MPNRLSLTGWVVLIFLLQAVAMALDGFRYLPLGKAGLLILKSGFFAFAVIMGIRFLSFRSQRTYESMVEAYNRIAPPPPWPLEEGSSGLRKYWFYMALLCVSSADFATLLGGGEARLRLAILLDGVFWTLLLWWVCRAQWLRSLRRKETLKSLLDDARSRMGPSNPKASPPEARLPSAGVVTMGALSLLISLGVTFIRWQRSPGVFRESALKSCLLECLERSRESFHGHGTLSGVLEVEPCLAMFRNELDVQLRLEEGEPTVWSLEKGGKDFFGNGKSGDQGLRVNSAGRFGRFGKAKEGVPSLP